MALVAVLGETVFASVNNYAFSFYIVDDLRRPASVVGILVSTFLIAELLLKLPFGHLSDRYGRRRFAMYGLAVCVVGPTVVCAVPAEVFLAAPALIYLVVLPTRVLDGAGAASLWPPLFAAVADHVPTRDRAAAMSVVNTAYLAGVALGPTLAGLAMKVARAVNAPQYWEGKAPFAMAAAAGALLASRLPASASAERREDDGAGRAAGVGGRMAAVITIISVAEMFATAVIAPYLALYVREVTGIERSNVGLLLLLLFVPVGLLGIPIGHLSDRLPRRRVVQAGFAAAAGALWLAPWCRSAFTLVSVGMVMALGFTFVLPSWMALISDLAPRGGAGRTIGLMATAQGVGAFLGPLAGGFIWQVSIRGPLYLSAAALSCAAATAVLLLPDLNGPRRARAGEADARDEEHPPSD